MLSIASYRRRLRRPTSRGPRLLLPGVLLATAAGLAFVYIGHVLWPRWPGPPVGRDAPPIPISIAGVVFNVPPASIRAPVQRRSGAQQRIDLSFLWPSLEPPDPSARLALPVAGEATLPTQTDKRIFVTIARAGEMLDPVERIRSIYPRYTAAQAQGEPGELAVLAFREGTPYQGEDLIYDAGKPGFIVRCTRDGPTPGTCLLERRIEGADLVLRFPREWLADWRSVAEGIERLVSRLRASY
jgi:hypothetical protein